MAAQSAPQVGSKAPEFQLPALPEGEPVRLADFQGQWVVLYFYPRDMTPGCTKEACGFRDALASPLDQQFAVLGVSTDSIARHQKFAEKHDLPFPLLADEDHAVAEKYGVWVRKMSFGKERWGLQRATFLIDPEGTIAATWPKVSVLGHVSEVTERLQELAS